MTSAEIQGLPPVAEWLPLLQEGLAREGRFRWQLRGTSMLPTLPAPCEIEIVPPSARIPLGSLIVFAHGASLVAHRLVYKGRGYWITQGDGRRGPDPRLSPDQVLGVVTAAYQNGVRCWPGHLSHLSSWLWVARAYGLWALRRAFRALARVA